MERGGLIKWRDRGRRFYEASIHACALIIEKYTYLVENDVFIDGSIDSSIKKRCHTRERWRERYDAVRDEMDYKSSPLPQKILLKPDVPLKRLIQVIKLAREGWHQLWESWERWVEIVLDIFSLECGGSEERAGVREISMTLQRVKEMGLPAHFAR